LKVIDFAVTVAIPVALAVAVPGGVAAMLHTFSVAEALPDERVVAVVAAHHARSIAASRGFGAAAVFVLRKIQ